MIESNLQQCELCGLLVEHVFRHHLIPRQKSKSMEKELRHGTIGCCLPCSKQVHALFSNSEMKRYFNTVERLKEDPRTQTWISWRRKHPGIQDISYSGKH